MRSLAAFGLVCVALAAACDGGGPPPDETPPTAAQGEYGSYPADSSLSEKEVVEAYVTALDERDGATFCSIVASWISGRYDIAGTDPTDESLSRPLRCPEIVSAFIGYHNENAESAYLGAELTDFGDLDRREELVGVPISVRLTLEADGSEYTEPLEDVVWLTRDAGAWRVAKLSQVAVRASIAIGAEGDLTAPPDVSAERIAFAAEAASAERRQRAYEDSFREVVAAVPCADAASYPDEARDVVDYRHPAPSSPTPQLAAADIRAVHVHASGGRICAVLEMRGDIRTGTTFDFDIESPDFDWGPSGFRQGFEVELRADGRARVTSGLDYDRRPISVPAGVGKAGNRLLLALDTESFGVGRTFPSLYKRPSRPPTRFRFLAQVTVELSESRHLHDNLGPGPGDVRHDSMLRFHYP